MPLPTMVSFRHLVRRPGFAHKYLEALFPEEEAQLAGMLAVFAREYGSRQAS